MTTPTPAAAPNNPPAQPTPAAAPASTSSPGQLASVGHPAATTPQRPLLRLKWLGALLGLAILAALCIYWWSYRLTTSITEDAFVEAHIVNVAPQSVSGHLVRFLVEENDRVEQGRVLAGRSTPCRTTTRWSQAQSKVEGAEAELKRQEAALARLRLEVPIQIEISQRTLAAAKADEARAQEALKLTSDEVEHGVEEAQAELEAVTADLVLAQQEYRRYTNLQKEDAVQAATPRR